jgi:nitroreductase
MNETINTITSHASVRRFKATPLAADLLELLKEVMRRGPTSSALQTYTIVFIQSLEIKETLQKYAGQQAFITESPLVIVACADLRRVRNITLTHGYPYRASDLRMLITSIEDLTIALQNASLTAQSLGLGTVMLGGVLNGSSEIAALLTLPRRIVPVLGLCVADIPHPPHVRSDVS